MDISFAIDTAVEEFKNTALGPAGKDMAGELRSPFAELYCAENGQPAFQRCQNDHGARKAIALRLKKLR